MMGKVKPKTANGTKSVTATEPEDASVPSGGKSVETSNLVVEDVTRKVVLQGLTDIMFDRYAGDNDTKLDWWQKLYYAPDGETLTIPALNVMSFLSAHNTNSAPKRLLDKRKYKDVCNACLSFVVISPMHIPILRDGKPIKFGKVEKDRDPKSGVYLHRSVARLKDGIPNPKERPVLPLPWELHFDLTVLANREISEQQIRNLFEAGGRALGLGTFRGVFGKFRVWKWA
jgi:hypothetical protein